jgi:lipopolysaccharide/colanic/teichoic acid biosynthesis glycosyltransferase
MPAPTTNLPINNGLPRPIEVTLALSGLILTAPLLLAAIALLALWEGGPIFFRQQRVGRYGRLFTLYKLRTMRPAGHGPQITAGDDQRITPLGRMLRQTKLDELPELWNVLAGDMSLVGPRPEAPCYVDLAQPLWRQVLEARPGLTDPITLRLRNEEALLAAVAGDREQFYLHTLQPFKLRGSLAYLRERSWRSDVLILGKTLVVIIFPRLSSPPVHGELLP